MTNTTTPSPNQRPSAADSQRTASAGDADRRAPSPSRGRGTYIKPHHLLIASLTCWAVVAAIIAGVLL